MLSSPSRASTKPYGWLAGPVQQKIRSESRHPCRGFLCRLHTHDAHAEACCLGCTPIGSPAESAGAPYDTTPVTPEGGFKAIGRLRKAAREEIDRLLLHRRGAVKTAATAANGAMQGCLAGRAARGRKYREKAAELSTTFSLSGPQRCDLTVTSDARDSNEGHRTRKRDTHKRLSYQDIVQSHYRLFTDLCRRSPELPCRFPFRSCCARRISHNPQNSCEQR
jgi:hypothetical protein